jgi:predicted short-subunit dehydrogenase-like oxidoreductase (DUF2520 family)
MVDQTSPVVRGAWRGVPELLSPYSMITAALSYADDAQQRSAVVLAVDR